MKTMILSCIAIALAMFFTVGQLPQVDDKVYGYGYYDDVLKYDVDGKDNFVILWDTDYDYEYIYTDAPYGTEIETVIMGSKYYTYIDTSGVEAGYIPIYLSAVTFEGYWIEIEIYDYYGYGSFPTLPNVTSLPPSTSQAPPSASMTDPVWTTTDAEPSMTVTTTPCYTTTGIPSSTTTTGCPSYNDTPVSTTVTKATTHNTSASMTGGATTSVPTDSVTSSETTSKYYPIIDNMAVGSVKVCNQYGDLNDDNMINLTDLTILSLYLLGDCELTESELYAANVEQYEDDSSDPDIADLAKLKQYILKQNVILGPEEIIIIYR